MLKDVRGSREVWRGVLECLEMVKQSIDLCPEVSLYTI